MLPMLLLLHHLINDLAQLWQLCFPGLLYSARLSLAVVLRLLLLINWQWKERRGEG